MKKYFIPEKEIKSIAKESKKNPLWIIKKSDKIVTTKEGKSKFGNEKFYQLEITTLPFNVSISESIGFAKDGNVSLNLAESLVTEAYVEGILSKHKK